ncbi:hypothetical protein QD712_02845 [Streptomyces acidiscabies]|uniref:hypothetical protein n=1 Tax=Streptomyces acidiscabies TaxID=42234 RepID=UPI0030CE5ADC
MALLTHRPGEDQVFTGIDEVDWTSLHHAHGDAGDVPGWLRALASEERGEREAALDALYGAVHHGGGVYDSTLAAVPFLLAVAAREGGGDRAGVLELLLSIGEEGGDSVGRFGGSGEVGAEGASGWVGGSGAAAVRAGGELFVALTLDSDPAVRRAAVTGVARFLDEPSRVLPLLSRRLRFERDDDALIAVVEAVGFFVRRHPAYAGEAVALLTTYLPSPNPPVLRLAVLGQLAAHAPDRLPPDLVALTARLLRERSSQSTHVCESPGSEQTLTGRLHRLRPSDEQGAHLMRTLHSALADDVPTRTALLQAQLRLPSPTDRCNAVLLSAGFIREWRADHSGLVALIGEQLVAEEERLRNAAVSVLGGLFGVGAPAADRLYSLVAGRPEGWVERWRAGGGTGLVEAAASGGGVGVGGRVTGFGGVRGLGGSAAAAEAGVGGLGGTTTSGEARTRGLDDPTAPEAAKAGRLSGATPSSNAQASEPDAPSTSNAAEVSGLSGTTASGNVEASEPDRPTDSTDAGVSRLSGTTPSGEAGTSRLDDSTTPEAAEAGGLGGSTTSSNAQASELDGPADSTDAGVRGLGSSVASGEVFPVGEVRALGSEVVPSGVSGSAGFGGVGGPEGSVVSGGGAEVGEVGPESVGGGGSVGSGTASGGGPRGVVVLGGALLALARCGDRRAVGVLREVLGDGELPRHAAAVVPYLGAGATSLAPVLRRHLEVVPLEQPEAEEVARGLLVAVGGLRDPGAVPGVVRVLERGVAGLVEAGFGALEAMESAAREALPVVRDALRGVHKGAAAAALWAIEPDVSLVLPVLLDELSSTDPHHRALTARRLSHLGPAARPALPRLRRLMTDSLDTWERVSAACVITSVTGEIESEVNTVLRSAWQSHPHTRVHIATTLTNLTPEAAAPLLDLATTELTHRRRHTTGPSGQTIVQDEKLLTLCRTLTAHL